MDTATEVLRREHEAILKMLEVAEEAARRLDRGENVTPDTLAGLLEFFRLFADRCHHGKEEDLLFPLLEKKGLPRAGGPIGVMLGEHEHGRAFVGQMAAAAEDYAKSDSTARRRWAEAARGYAELLRQHIHKENDVLFMVAENLLTGAEQAELARAFERVEEEKLGPGTHERLHALMDRLSAQVLSP
jgi:hemerythrin-like domain-containing protein